MLLLCGATVSGWLGSGQKELRIKTSSRQETEFAFLPILFRHARLAMTHLKLADSKHVIVNCRHGGDGGGDGGGADRGVGRGGAVVGGGDAASAAVAATTADSTADKLVADLPRGCFCWN